MTMPDVRFNAILTPPVETLNTQNISKKTEHPSTSFSDILSEALEDADGVKFSKHAQSRLESRNIELDEDNLKKLGGAVDAAAQKGVRDSLILMNGLAFIVDVSDRTVVTAMPVDEASSNVFTNIDGAVIV